MVTRTISQLFAMDERTWRGHANPWCFWTRLSVMPLLFLAIWSRVWLGWGALWPIAIALGQRPAVSAAQVNPQLGVKGRVWRAGVD